MSAFNYVSDADLWVCTCTARLTELARLDATLPTAWAGQESVARALYRDPECRGMDPSVAAEAHLHAQRTRAE